MKMDPRMMELLDRYLDGALSPQEVLELETWLSGSAEARAAFWDRARLHSTLRMAAQELRGAKLARETEPQFRVVAQPKRPVVVRSKVTRFPSNPKTVLFTEFLKYAAVIALSAMAAWAWRQYEPMARVSTTVAAKWEGKDQTIGKELRRGPLKLVSGIAEITFLNGAQIVIEGPADLEIVGRNDVRLRRGRLSATIPPPAHGFTVETPSSKLVDMGTRFGVAVKGESASEMEVFEGKVKVSGGSQSLQLGRGEAVAAGSGGLVREAADPSRFPQPGRVISNLLRGGDFEPGASLETASVPQQSGKWSGVSVVLDGATEGVSPRTGSGMLGFDIGGEQDVEQWQLVDLRAVKEAARGQSVPAKFSVWLNRLITGESPGIFTVTLAAFRGSPESAPALWEKRRQLAVAYDEQTLWSDGDPQTWQRLDTSISVPHEADFLLVCIAAKSREPSDQPHLFSHFADSASLEVQIPPTPSLFSLNK